MILGTCWFCLGMRLCSSWLMVMTDRALARWRLHNLGLSQTELNSAAVTRTFSALTKARRYGAFLGLAVELN